MNIKQTGKIGKKNTLNLIKENTLFINSPINELVILMTSVKTNTSEAKLNETSINNNKGGRILL